MKRYLLSILVLAWPILLFSQLSFEDFNNFKKDVSTINFEDLKSIFVPQNQSYYKGFSGTPAFQQIKYLDSMFVKFDMTVDEMELIHNNHFVVTERVSYNSFGDAYLSIYQKDLPVFISTDLILHAFHTSYDAILMDIEANVMYYNLLDYLTQAYNEVVKIENEFSDAGIDSSLADIDLYYSVALSLIQGDTIAPHFSKIEKYNAVMAAIKQEQAIEMALFTKPSRRVPIDFSQLF